MASIRIFGGPGNEYDFEVDAVPRIGERVELNPGIAGQPGKTHYFRVHDVIHKLDNGADHRIAVLVTEEDESKLLPQ